MLYPMRDKKMKARTWGKKGRVATQLVQKIAEGKTSYEF